MGITFTGERDILPLWSCKLGSDWVRVTRPWSLCQVSKGSLYFLKLSEVHPLLVFKEKLLFNEKTGLCYIIVILTIQNYCSGFQLLWNGLAIKQVRCLYFTSNECLDKTIVGIIPKIDF